MTEFSELEKEILRHMVQLNESNDLCINSWLSKLFKGHISLKHIPGDKPFQYKIEVKYSGISENELISKIKYFHFLVERLTIDHLIKMDLLGNTEFEFKEINQTESYTFQAFSKHNLLYQFFSLYGNCPILVSQYIVELVGNNFQTSEQLRFVVQLEKAKMQVKIAWAAFFVACITLLIPLFSETKINNDQFDQIKQTIHQNEIPDVIKTEITNDTLITKIVGKAAIQENKVAK